MQQDAGAAGPPSTPSHFWGGLWGPAPPPSAPGTPLCWDRRLLRAVPAPAGAGAWALPPVQGSSGSEGKLRHAQALDLQQGPMSSWQRDLGRTFRDRESVPIVPSPWGGRSPPAQGCHPAPAGDVWPWSLALCWCHTPSPGCVSTHGCWLQELPEQGAGGIRSSRRSLRRHPPSGAEKPGANSGFPSRIFSPAFRSRPGVNRSPGCQEPVGLAVTAAGGGAPSPAPAPCRHLPPRPGTRPPGDAREAVAINF